MPRWPSGRDLMLNVRLHPTTMNDLDRKAAERGLNRSDLVRSILAAWLEQN